MSLIDDKVFPARHSVNPSNWPGWISKPCFRPRPEILFSKSRRMGAGFFVFRDRAALEGRAPSRPFFGSRFLRPRRSSALHSCGRPSGTGLLTREDRRLVGSVFMGRETHATQPRTRNQEPRTQDSGPKTQNNPLQDSRHTAASSAFSITANGGFCPVNSSNWKSA